MRPFVKSLLPLFFFYERGSNYSSFRVIILSVRLSVRLSVCLSVCHNCESYENAELIEMRFGLLAPVDSKNRDVGVLPLGKGQFGGSGKKQFKTTN